MTRPLACLALFFAACGNPTGYGAPSAFDAVSGYAGTPAMDPGQNCMICHAANLRAATRPWTVAGTVYGSATAAVDAGVPDALVLVTDGAGKSLTLVSNAAGNFYTDEPLQFPLSRLEVDRGGVRMAMNLSSSLVPPALGSCNQCHAQPSAFNAPGRLFVPPKAPSP
ncbi:MAG: hypothetical protein ACYCWW_13995 [Deltaproteobacteria bacterium]